MKPCPLCKALRDILKMEGVSVRDEGQGEAVWNDRAFKAEKEVERLMAIIITAAKSAEEVQK